GTRPGYPRRARPAGRSPPGAAAGFAAAGAAAHRSRPPVEGWPGSRRQRARPGGADHAVRPAVAASRPAPGRWGAGGEDADRGRRRAGAAGAGAGPRLRSGLGETLRRRVRRRRRRAGRAGPGRRAAPGPGHGRGVRTQCRRARDRGDARRRPPRRAGGVLRGRRRPARRRRTHGRAAAAPASGAGTGCMSTVLRVSRIGRVLLRYRLDSLLEGSPAERSLRLMRPFVPRASSEVQAMPRGARLRLALQELGPLFVKFGQILSTRRDLVPPDIAQELALLQDQVAPFDGDTARALVEQALERSIDEAFASFD